jgi:hypothetical protein
MTRRAGILLIALAAVSLAGPWLAPYDPGTRFREFLFAPPMPPRVFHESAAGDQSVCRWPACSGRSCSAR